MSLNTTSGQYRKHEGTDNQLWDTCDQGPGTPVLCPKDPCPDTVYYGTMIGACSEKSGSKYQMFRNGTIYFPGDNTLWTPGGCAVEHAVCTIKQMHYVNAVERAFVQVSEILRKSVFLQAMVCAAGTAQGKEDILQEMFYGDLQCPQFMPSVAAVLLEFMQLPSNRKAVAPLISEDFVVRVWLDDKEMIGGVGCPFTKHLKVLCEGFDTGLAGFQKWANTADYL